MGDLFEFVGSHIMTYANMYLITGSAPDGVCLNRSPGTDGPIAPYLAAMTYPTITLKKGREGALQRFSPWLFSGSVAREDEGIEDGDTVRVVDSAGNSL